MAHVRMIAAAFMLVLIGCSQDASGPGGTGGAGVVQLNVATGGGQEQVSLGKVDGTVAGVESLVVSRAVLVFKDIRFLEAPDTTHLRDSIECWRDGDWEDRWGRKKDTTLHFKGPFVVVLQDTTPVQIALDTIPPGQYTGIKFNIHRVRRSDLERDPQLPDSLLGYSVVVTGSVKYAAGAWVPFVFKTDINEDFKVRGDFTVAEGQTLTPYVLNLDIASWFRAPGGMILDPNGFFERHVIRFMIKGALKGRMFGGRDWNRDGHPDHRWF